MKLFLALQGLSAAGKGVAAVGAVTLATAGAGAAGALPTPAQHAFAVAVRSATPFSVPDGVPDETAVGASTTTDESGVDPAATSGSASATTEATEPTDSPDGGTTTEGSEATDDSEGDSSGTGAAGTGESDSGESGAGESGAGATDAEASDGQAGDAAPTDQETDPESHGGDAGKGDHGKGDHGKGDHGDGDGHRDGETPPPMTISLACGRVEAVVHCSWSGAVVADGDELVLLRVGDGRGRAFFPTGTTFDDTQVVPDHSYGYSVIVHHPGDPHPVARSNRVKVE